MPRFDRQTPPMGRYGLALPLLAVLAGLGSVEGLAVAGDARSERERPVVKVVATGGTIANTPGGRISVEQIIASIPEVLEIADIDVEDHARVPSPHLTFQDFIDVGRRVARLAGDPVVDGVVVTIGSNAAEDLAWFLNLTLATDKPVVVTAAQRQRTTLSEDSSRNFVDAVRVAGSRQARGKGVLLVANELIHAAREVTKNVASRVDTWQSLDTGALGIVSGPEVHFYRAPLRRHTAGSEFRLEGLSDASQLPKVEILYTYVDADPGLIRTAADLGAKGLIIAAYPTGSPTATQFEALQKAVRQHGVAVVIASRGTSGRLRPTNDTYPSADTLTPQKAQILLKFALAAGADDAGIRRIFREY